MKYTYKNASETDEEEIDDNISLQRICRVEYPAVVKNESAMLKTLGGMKQVTEILSQERKRLELSFLPENVYAKPALATKVESNGLLIKAKLRRNKRTGETQYSHDIIGYVDATYKFSNLADYQYLPVKTVNNEKRMIYHDLMPNTVHNVDWLKSKTEIPFFLPPSAFSRNETVQDTFFKGNQITEATSKNVELIGRTRNRSKNHVICLVFDNHSAIPDKPLPKAYEVMKAKIIQSDHYNTVKELFSKRPVWSRMALSFESKISNDYLKFLLPAFAYYYTNGPWRAMWVRFGYDPRTLFDSRFYQILDYRIRTNIGLQSYITAKRESGVPNAAVKQKSKTIVDGTQLVEKEAGAVVETPARSRRVYNPYYSYGELPEMRQTFYQYCDINVPKIQEMLEKIPTPSSGAVCNDKTGWLPVGFERMCRDIITQGIKDSFKESASGLKSENDEEYDYDEYEEESDYEDENLDVDDEEDLDMDEENV